MGAKPFTEAEANRVCVICKKAFRRRKRTKPTLTCSTACRIELSKKDKGKPKTFVRSAAWLRSRTIKSGTCLLWTGVKDSDGYGRVIIHKNPYITTGAHRLFWELQHGIISNEYDVLHHCDTPACVNVEHLFLGTHEDNMADMANKGRAKSGNVKLTAKEVVEIYRLASTIDKNTLAKQFHVDPATIVYHLKKRKENGNRL